jgi:outer membrane protein assembly factor BamB
VGAYVCLVPLPVGANDWTAFRGTGDGRATQTVLPSEWAADRNIAWDVKLPGGGQSSPVLWKDKIFLTATQGDNKETLLALCYSAKDGKLLWRKDLPSSRPQKRAPRTSLSAPTAAVDGKLVYFLFDSTDVFAFDHAGRQKWHTDLNKLVAPFQIEHDFGSSIRPTRDGLVVHLNHLGPSAVVSLAKSSGQLQWKHDLAPEGGSWNTPLVTGTGDAETVLFSRAGGVVALSAKSGERRWGYEAKWSRGTALPSLVTAGDLVIVPSAERTGTVAISMAKPGELVWRAKQATNGMISPLVVGDYLFLVNTIGVVQCLRATTGEELWQYRMPGSGWAAPIGAGNQAYFFTADGTSVILAAGPELKVLQKNELPLAQPLYAVVPAGNGLLFRTPGELLKVAPVAAGKSVRLEPAPAKKAAPGAPGRP